MANKKIVKEYSNDDITVIWQADLCAHSANCWKALLPVFDPRCKPWINMQAGTTEEIIKTVNNCPSKALSFRYKSENDSIK